MTCTGVVCGEGETCRIVNTTSTVCECKTYHFRKDGVCQQIKEGFKVSYDHLGRLVSYNDPNDQILERARNTWK